MAVEWRQFYLFQSTSSWAEPSRDNINIKFIYPLQIWCDGFFSLRLLRHSPHIIIIRQSRNEGSVNCFGSMRRARTMPPMQILDVINTQSQIYPSIYELSMWCRSSFFLRHAIPFDWAILKWFIRRHQTERSEKEHINDENDEKTDNALLSPNVGAAVGVCLRVALDFFLLFSYLWMPFVVVVVVVALQVDI